jgi:hypothetical protein
MLYLKYNNLLNIFLLPGDEVAIMGMVPTGRRSLETPKSSPSLGLTSKLKNKNNFIKVFK